MSRLPTYTIIVLALCIASSKVHALASLFVYDREAIFRGELWRLVTSHLVHFSDLHLFYNMVAFGIVGWLIEHKGYRYFRLLCLLMACSISAVLVVFKPGMIYFGGLSGIACGAIVYTSLLSLREPYPWRTLGMYSIIFVFVKISLETCNNGSLLPYLEAQNFIPIPLSHIAGSISALILFLFTQKLAQNKSSCYTHGALTIRGRAVQQVSR